MRALALALLLPACGARVIADSTADTDSSTPSTSSDTTPSTSVTTTTPPPAPCHCIDAPNHVQCVQPEECCPTVGECKNPATWNCSGSAAPCP